MIREATPADLSALADVQAALARPNPVLLSWAVDGPGLVLVSTADGSVAGYVLAVEGPNATHVAEVAVRPGRRREGRAGALLDRVLSRAAAASQSRVTLAVQPENEAARRLYESRGFEVVERLPEYYENGAAALSMARRP